MRILFWGTPDFARTVLRGLLREGWQVVGVVTQPDRPAGRGRRLKPGPVKKLAVENVLPVLQPERPKGDDFLRALTELRPDISVVAAYGRILSGEVLDQPPFGSYNVHASLLPDLRGAAPIAWAIIRGYRETGVSIMRMVERMDAGPTIVRARYPIPPDATAGRLGERLAELGARALPEALRLIAAGEAIEEPQDEAAASYAPKLTAEDARLDWSRSATELERWVRGTDPTPAAWSELGGTRVRFFSPRVADPPVVGDPGVVVAADARQGLEVACGDGAVWLDEVQPAGKRRMAAKEWIRGRGVAVGDRFG